MKDLKLNKLSEKAMDSVKGGVLKSPIQEGKAYYIACPEGESMYTNCCGCGCYYADQEGSSIADNRSANKNG